MKAIAILLLLSIASVSQDAPKMGWVKTAERGISLKATSQMPFRLAFKRGVRIRIDVSADSGVSLFVARQYIDFWKRPAYANPICRVERSFKTSTWCVINTDEPVLLVSDNRTAIDVIAGVEGRGSEATTRAAAENKVMIVLYRWDCIENCPLKKAATN